MYLMGVGVPYGRVCTLWARMYLMRVYVLCERVCT